MSLSVREDRLVAVNRIGENTLQSVLQGTVELPGDAPPVERVVWVKASPPGWSLRRRTRIGFTSKVSST